MKSAMSFQQTARILAGWLMLSMSAIGQTLPPPAPLPPIEIHPEIYLGVAPPPPPAVWINKRLPWPMDITLIALDGASNVVAGPLILSVAEEYAGSSFKQAALKPKSVKTEGSNSVPVQVVADGATELQALEFAVHTAPKGANIIFLKCFVRLKMAKDGEAADYQTLTTVECHPDRETTLARFPNIEWRIKARWNNPTTF